MRKKVVKRTMKSIVEPKSSHKLNQGCPQITKDNVMKLDSSYIGRKEMKYLRDVCRHGDRQWVESNFPSLVNYAIYVCSNKQRSN